MEEKNNLNGEQTCIHLYACRRLQKIYSNNGKYIPRGCDRNVCKAFIDGSLLTNCINIYDNYKYGMHEEIEGFTIVETPNCITLNDVINNEINEDQNANESRRIY